MRYPKLGTKIPNWERGPKKKNWAKQSGETNTLKRGLKRPQANLKTKGGWENPKVGYEKAPKKTP